MKKNSKSKNKLHFIEYKNIFNAVKEKFEIVKKVFRPINNWRKRHLIKEEKDKIFVLDSFDLAYVRIIAFSVFFIFLLWVLNNYIRSPFCVFKILVF
ncbi:hypothetical protein KKC59_00510, partial [bacterium]|nr:hypothetical protein [bacterium]